MTEFERLQNRIRRLYGQQAISPAQHNYSLALLELVQRVLADSVSSGLQVKLEDLIVDNEVVNPASLTLVVAPASGTNSKEAA